MAGENGTLQAQLVEERKDRFRAITELWDEVRRIKMTVKAPLPVKVEANPHLDEAHRRIAELDNKVLSHSSNSEALDQKVRSLEQNLANRPVPVAPVPVYNNTHDLQKLIETLRKDLHHQDERTDELRVRIERLEDLNSSPKTPPPPPTASQRSDNVVALSTKVSSLEKQIQEVNISFSSNTLKIARVAILAPQMSQKEREEALAAVEKAALGASTSNSQNTRLL